MRSIAISCPRWCDVWVIRRIITHARERRTSKNFVSSLHQESRLFAQGSEAFFAVLGIAVHEP